MVYSPAKNSRKKEWKEELPSKGIGSHISVLYYIFLLSLCQNINGCLLAHHRIIIAVFDYYYFDPPPWQ